LEYLFGLVLLFVFEETPEKDHIEYGLDLLLVYRVTPEKDYIEPGYVSFNDLLQKKTTLLPFSLLLEFLAILIHSI
jgi:hypothetical protein